jgi:hypothetical protein
MSQELKTVAEADHLLRELHKASVYCTGENSSRQHNQRIREVETERLRLLEVEAERIRLMELEGEGED